MEDRKTEQALRDYEEASQILNLDKFQGSPQFPLMQRSLKKMVEAPDQGLEWVRSHKSLLLSQIDLIK